MSRTHYYKKAPHSLKKKDNPSQLYKRISTDNEFMYELYPVDGYGNRMTGPVIIVPNYHMMIVDDEERPKTFEDLRPKKPMSFI